MTEVNKLMPAIQGFLARASESEREEFRMFIDVSPRTLTRWQTGAHKHEGGLKHLRIRHFLERRGVRIEELESLKEPLLALSRMLAFGVLTLEQARDGLGYRDAQQVFTIVFGKHEPKKTRRALIKRLVALNQAALEQKMSASGKRATNAIASSVAADPASGSVTDEAKQAMIHSFVLLARTMLPLAEALASDDFTPEDRKDLRERKLPGNGVFKLHTAFNGLCSETARNRTHS